MMRLPKLRFWNSWDDRQKANAVKWTGAVIALFALFTLLAMVSYIFTWKQDQSLLRDPGLMDQAVGVANLGGKLGLKWANTLMVKWFGLGSFAFLILLFAMAARLLAGRWHRSLLKTAAVTLSGALIAALACAYVGRLVGVQTLFGAGPGGECGAHVTGWFWNLLGPAVTGVLLGGAGDSPWLLAAVLACAVAKGWLIGERFMELAHAPALWRRLLLAWPLLMALAVGAALYLARMNN